jgi:elongation factor 1-beta
LPGTSTAGQAFVQSASAPAPAAADDEEEVDLFADDDEEDDAEAERLKAERVATYNAKKANKPKAAAKVNLFAYFILWCL